MRTWKAAAALVLAATLVAIVAGPARADEMAEQIREVVEKIEPSLAVATFYIERDDGQRADIRVPAVAVGPDNLMMITSIVISDRFAAEQYHDFKIAVGDDEYDAEYLGKDDTARVAFLRTTDPEAPTLPAVEFARDPTLELGEPVITFAMLGEANANKLVIRTSRIAARIDKPYTVYLLDGGVGNQGAPTVLLNGTVVGVVGLHMFARQGQQGQPSQVLWPTARFAERLDNPPTGGERIREAWLGVAALNPVTKNLAEFYDLGDARGVIVGRVIEGTPADGVDLQPTDIILSIDGEDVSGPEGQLVQSFQNMLREKKIGQEITLEVFREGRGAENVSVVLGEQPKTAGEAERYRNDQFGFAVRELVLGDTLVRDLPTDEPGALVSFVESAGWAEAGGLREGDIVKKVGDRGIADLDEFKAAFTETIEDRPGEVVLFVLRGKKDTKLVRIEPRWAGDGDEESQ